MQNKGHVPQADCLGVWDTMTVLLENGCKSVVHG